MRNIRNRPYTRGTYGPRGFQVLQGRSAFISTPEQILHVGNLSGDTITLPANRALILLNSIDLEGYRIYSPGDLLVRGVGSGVSTLTSTGLSSGYLLNSDGELALREVTLSAPSGTTAARGNGGASKPFSARSTNFSGAGDACEIASAADVLFDDCAWFSGGDLIELTGNISGTLAMTESFMSISDGSTGILLNGAVGRRLRIGESTIALNSAAAQGLNTPLAHLPSEAEIHIMDTVRFSGGAAEDDYVTGIDYLDDQSRWRGCRGVTNTGRIGVMYLEGNATATTIGATNTFVKVAGTTTADSKNQRFSHTDNRLTYDSGIQAPFFVEVIITMSSGNNQELDVQLYKNGVMVPGFTARAITGGNGRALNVAYGAYVILDKDDYIEVFVANETSTANITVSDMFVSAVEAS